MNRVQQVQRTSTGTVKEVIVDADGVIMTFIKGANGRPRIVSRRRGAMVYTSTYVPHAAYVGALRQVEAIMSEPPKRRTTSKPTVKSECIEEPDNGRCPGCTKDSLDTSSCFDSCPLYDGE